jgi:hypothetical protein
MLVTKIPLAKLGSNIVTKRFGTTSKLFTESPFTKFSTPVTDSNFSASGSSTTELVRNVQKDGWQVIEKINIVKNWNTLSKRTKYIIGGYSGLAVCNLLASTYNKGKEALIDFRTQSTTNKSDDGGEWLAVRKGCSDKFLTTVGESIMLPYTALSKIMPWLVIKLNPKPKQQ